MSKAPRGKAIPPKHQSPVASVGPTRRATAAAPAARALQETEQRAAGIATTAQKHRGAPGREHLAAALCGGQGVTYIYITDRE